VPAPNGEYLASLPEVREAVSRLRGCRQEYRQFFAELVGRIGALSDALAERQKCLEHRANDQQRREWDTERSAMVTELEVVRNRAAEMTDLLDQQKRGAEQQQVQWSEELRQMRQLLGGIMEHMEQHEVAAPAAGPAPRALAAADDGEGKPEQPSTPSETESSDDDPVLDSVMAQFEILQKDIARRKKAKS